MTTKQEIGVWFDQGLEEKAEYLIVIWDSFSNDDYPVFVGPPNKIHDAIKYYRRSPMQQIMEVYDLGLDKQKQLDTPRVYNIPPVPKDDTDTRSTSAES